MFDAKGGEGSSMLGLGGATYLGGSILAYLFTFGVSICEIHYYAFVCVIHYAFMFTTISM